jgi:hypothetical protein
MIRKVKRMKRTKRNEIINDIRESLKHIENNLHNDDLRDIITILSAELNELEKLREELINEKLKEVVDNG